MKLIGLLRGRAAWAVTRSRRSRAVPAAEAGQRTAGRRHGSRCRPTRSTKPIRSRRITLIRRRATASRAYAPEQAAPAEDQPAEPEASADPQDPGYAMGPVNDPEIDATLERLRRVGRGPAITVACGVLTPQSWAWISHPTSPADRGSGPTGAGPSRAIGTGAGCPFHYGRWDWFDDGGYWGWVPGYEWGPGWVDWRHGGGYVGWRPIAADRPRPPRRAPRPDVSRPPPRRARVALEVHRRQRLRQGPHPAPPLQGSRGRPPRDDAGRAAGDQGHYPAGPRRRDDARAAREPGLAPAARASWRMEAAEPASRRVAPAAARPAAADRLATAAARPAAADGLATAAAAPADVAGPAVAASGVARTGAVVAAAADRGPPADVQPGPALQPARAVVEFAAPDVHRADAAELQPALAAELLATLAAKLLAAVALVQPAVALVQRRRRTRTARRRTRTARRRTRTARRRTRMAAAAVVGTRTAAAGTAAAADGTANQAAHARARRSPRSPDGGSCVRA